jgi:hypothetical protein
MGMLRGDVQASERGSDKPLGAISLPGMRGKPVLSKGGEEVISLR